LWEKVQKILHEKAIRYVSKHVSTAKFYRYRGLLRCGHCDQVLTPTDMSSNYKNKKPGELIYYRCTYSKKNVDSYWYKDRFGEKHSEIQLRKGWIDSEKDKESTFNARWSEPFHELWFN